MSAFVFRAPVIFPHLLAQAMLTDATLALIQTARDDTATDADLNSSAVAFFKAMNGASLDEANDALRTLSAHFRLEKASRGAFLALVCGAVVESGGDPRAMAAPLLELLASLLRSSAELASACVDRMPAAKDEDQDPNELFETIREQIAPTMSRQDAAWEALAQFWRPAIAVFSYSPESRAAARSLREFAAKISDFHEGGYWLNLMLEVLDDEPVVAIEPQSGIGILGRISGVVDNFQLNMLLMDAFPSAGLSESRRIPQEVVDVARGNGPQQSDHTVTGVWNLYTWEAIEAGLVLPDPNDYDSSDHWIWNEGTPADIPMFAGRRIVLLGPASYSRSWQAQRMFDNLPANFEVERELTKGEVNDWLQRMVAAKSSS